MERELLGLDGSWVLQSGLAVKGIQIGVFRVDY